jgi:hypothetical protein
MNSWRPVLVNHCCSGNPEPKSLLYFYMNFKSYRKLIGVAAIAISPLLSGCRQSTAYAQPAPIAPARSNVSVAAHEADLRSEVTPPPAPTSETAFQKPEPAPSAEPKPAPPEVRFSSSTAEIIKLAQGGVDQSVILSYVTNTAGAFNLGSDEIVYLSDLGVESTVINAMMEHDRVLGISSQVAASASQAPQPSVQQPPPTQAELQAAAQPAQPVTVNYFYSSLAPYGTWVEIDGYGRCWQPTAVVLEPDWQPYCNRGRWVYTDCGWYWYSEYSWGYNTFHYGRWFRHSRFGWCWYPDTVWGPAWVTWRYSNDYCGWAPLPPHSYYRPGVGFTYYDRSVSFSFSFGLSADCYTFIPSSRFCDSRPWHYRAPRTRITNIYNNTTIINNYGSGNNNTVINHGIPVDRVSAATRTPIRPVAVRETSSHPLRGERSERRGSQTVIYRPPTSTSTAAGTSASTLGNTTPRDRSVSPRTSVLPKTTTREESRRGSTETSTSATTARQDGRTRTTTDSSARPAQPTVLPKANPSEERRGESGRIDASRSVGTPGTVTETRTQPLRTETPTSPNRSANVTRPSVSQSERREISPTPRATTVPPGTISRQRETTPSGSLIYRGNQSQQAPATPSVRAEPSTRNIHSQPKVESPRARSAEIPNATVPNPSPTVVTPTRVVPPTTRIDRQESYRSTPGASSRIQREEVRRPEPTVTPRVIDRPDVYRATPTGPRQSENIYSVPRSRSSVVETPRSTRSESYPSSQSRSSRGENPAGWDRSKSKDRP